MSKAEYLAELDRIEAQSAAAMQAPDANAQQIELAAIKRMAIAYKAFKGQHDDRTSAEPPADHQPLSAIARAEFAPTGSQSTIKLPGRDVGHGQDLKRRRMNSAQSVVCTFSAIPKDGVASQRAASKRSLNPCCAPTDASNELEKPVQASSHDPVV